MAGWQQTCCHEFQNLHEVRGLHIIHKECEDLCSMKGVKLWAGILSLGSKQWVGSSHVNLAAVRLLYARALPTWPWHLESNHDPWSYQAILQGTGKKSEFNWVQRKMLNDQGTAESLMRRDLMGKPFFFSKYSCNHMATLYYQGGENAQGGEKYLC